MLEKGNFNKAIDFYNQSLAQKASHNNHNYMSEDLRLKAEAYQKLGQLDSCIVFAKQAYEQAKLERSPRLQIGVTALLTACAALTQSSLKRADFKKSRTVWGEIFNITAISLELLP